MPPAAMTVVLAHPADVDGWRRQARALLAARVAPERVLWRLAGAEDDLFAVAAAPADVPATTASDDRLAVPRRFLDLASQAVCHADAARFACLYKLLWRLGPGGEPALLADAADPLIRRVETMAAQVRRETHRMHAFVRFRRVTVAEAIIHLAWFEPAHHVLARAAPFFVARFAAHPWSILTPAASVHWDGDRLRLAPGARKADALGEDAVEDLWRRYYASTFNPARVNPRAVRAQMPARFWPNLPEATLIPTLFATAEALVRAMPAAPAAARPRRGGKRPR